MSTVILAIHNKMEDREITCLFAMTADRPLKHLLKFICIIVNLIKVLNDRRTYHFFTKSLLSWLVLQLHVSQACVVLLQEKTAFGCLDKQSSKTFCVHSSRGLQTQHLFIPQYSFNMQKKLSHMQDGRNVQVVGVSSRKVHVKAKRQRTWHGNLVLVQFGHRNI